MHFFSIWVMTVFALLVFGWLIASSQHVNLYSLRNLFMASWLFYGFAVGIDLMTGAEIPFTPNEADLMDPETWGSVSFVMLNYVLCGIAFLVTYFIMQGNREIRPIEFRYSLEVPPAWVLILIHLAIGYLYARTFLGMGRMERFAIYHESPAHKFTTVLVTLAFAIDILIILTGKRSPAVATALTSGVLLALLTGDRTYVILICLCAIYHWRPKLHGWRLIGLVSLCIAVIFTLKTVYAVGLSWWNGDRVSFAMIAEHLSLSLTRLDAGASYLIAIFYTDQDSPLWLGSSYTFKTLQLAWPRFLGGVRVSTLSEDYIWTYHYETAVRGGGMAFSAVAEAWLNFSYFGGIVLGTFWGIVANWFDRRPRTALFYLVLMMTSRIFRTDFASLIKTWMLVWGTVFIVAFVLLSLYSMAVRGAGTRRPLTRTRPTPNRLPWGNSVP